MISLSAAVLVVVQERSCACIGAEIVHGSENDSSFSDMEEQPQSHIQAAHPSPALSSSFLLTKTTASPVQAQSVGPTQRDRQQHTLTACAQTCKPDTERLRLNSSFQTFCTDSNMKKLVNTQSKCVTFHFVNFNNRL